MLLSTSGDNEMKGTRTVSLCVRLEMCKRCFVSLMMRVTARQGLADACPIVVTRDIRDLTRPL
jgi:hypothetical protein